MDIDHISSPSSDFLRLVEGFGLAGSWTWNFDSTTHVWSPGLYSLLGLKPGTVVPSYQRLLDQVHPDDRSELESHDEIVHYGFLRPHTFRIVRTDGAFRILELRGEVYYRPDGRPMGAAGILIDVTEREQLMRVNREIDRRHRLIFDQYRTWTARLDFTLSSSISYNPSRELLELTGFPRDELAYDISTVVVSRERRDWKTAFAAQLAERKPFTVTPTLKLIDGGEFRLCGRYVPMINPDGRLIWAVMNGPYHPDTVDLTLQPQHDIDEAIDGHHIRAARSLLDWSMADLAKASRLSLSTVRRMEEAADSTKSKTHRLVVQALRAGGATFSLLADGTIAVSRR